MEPDIMLIATQDWLVNTYGNNPLFTINVPTDGTGRAITIKALIQALQIELGVDADGIWGNSTANAFDILFQNGLSENTQVNNSSQIINIIYILQGAFYTSRGIAPGGLDGCFGASLTSAIEQFQSQVGVTQDGIVKAYLMKAILTTDGYELDSTNGDSNIRTIQQSLNNRYFNSIGIIPTNGIYERQTNIALIKAIQIEINVSADGLWGEGTMSALPVLRRYATITNTQTVYILQYILYLNGYNPNGFDGGFGAGVQNAVRACQTDYNLDVDGICGRKTWSALFVSCGDKTRTATACDTAYEITANRATILRNNGYNVVGRYLTGSSKKIQDGEIQTILSAGLKFFPIYQENNTELSDFTLIKGIEQAIKAIKAAKSYGLPSNTVIYFAVDCDLYESQVRSNVVPYFRGINHIFDADGTFRVGVYGTRQTCSILYEEGLSNYSFVADASYRFEGNVAKRRPSTCCYSQFATDIYIAQGFPIDKIEDTGKIQAVNNVVSYNNIISDNDPNSAIYDMLDKLYALAAEYNRTKGLTDIIDNNLLVLDYLRYSEYSSDFWNVFTREIDTDWIQFVNNNLTITVNKTTPTIFIEELNDGISLPHLVAASYNAAYQYTENISQFRAIFPVTYQYFLFDYVGWAGDLISLGGELEKSSLNDPTILDRLNDTMIYNLVGCENHQYEVEVGIEPMFPIDDLYQDVDGINIGLTLNVKTIGEAFKDYYSGNLHESRFQSFITNRRNSPYPATVDDTHGDLIFLRSLAYQYTKTNFYMDIMGLYKSLKDLKDGDSTLPERVGTLILMVKEIADLIEDYNGNFSEKIWGYVLAYGFAAKVIAKKDDEIDNQN